MKNKSQFKCERERENENENMATDIKMIGSDDDY